MMGCPHSSNGEIKNANIILVRKPLGKWMLRQLRKKEEITLRWITGK
jgi:hypothetical protein